MLLLRSVPFNKRNIIIELKGGCKCQSMLKQLYILQKILLGFSSLFINMSKTCFILHPHYKGISVLLDKQPG